MTSVEQLLEMYERGDITESTLIIDVVSDLKLDNVHTNLSKLPEEFRRKIEEEAACNMWYMVAGMEMSDPQGSAVRFNAGLSVVRKHYLKTKVPSARHDGDLELVDVERFCDYLKGVAVTFRVKPETAKQIAAVMARHWWEIDNEDMPEKYRQ